jgi:hypothetical protein
MLENDDLLGAQAENRKSGTPLAPLGEVLQ